MDELDYRRQISDEEKIAIFSNRQSCELCNMEFKDYKEAEYHHKKRYSDGGKTNIENIMILCNICHEEIHGKSKILLPSEEELEEIE